MIDTLYIVTCSSPGAPYPTSGAEAPAALQQFIYQELSTYLSGIINLFIRRELEMVDIGESWGNPICIFAQSFIHSELSSTSKGVQVEVK